MLIDLRKYRTHPGTLQKQLALYSEMGFEEITNETSNR